MRQGGFVPKNHNSGVYWIRANAGGGGKSSAEENKEEYPVWIYVSAITSGIIFFIGLVIYAY